MSKSGFFPLGHVFGPEAYCKEGEYYDYMRQRCRPERTQEYYREQLRALGPLQSTGRFNVFRDGSSAVLTRAPDPRLPMPLPPWMHSARPLPPSTPPPKKAITKYRIPKRK